MSEATVIPMPKFRVGEFIRHRRFGQKFKITQLNYSPLAKSFIVYGRYGVASLCAWQEDLVYADASA